MEEKSPANNGALFFIIFPVNKYYSHGHTPLQCTAIRYLLF